jgi:hypothetical protein
MNYFTQDVVQGNVLVKAIVFRSHEGWLISGTPEEFSFFGMVLLQAFKLLNTAVMIVFYVVCQKHLVVFTLSCICRIVNYQGFCLRHSNGHPY